MERTVRVLEIQPAHVIAIEIKSLDIRLTDHDSDRTAEVAITDIVEERLGRLGAGADHRPVLEPILS